MAGTRVIFYHKHHTSARTRFLVMQHGGVCAPDPLPTLSQIIEKEVGAADDPDKVALHPAAPIRAVEQGLGLASGDVEPQGSFRVKVDAPGGEIQIFLARFTAIDPPFDLAERIEGRFIDLTQARGLCQTELEMLRSAYEYILG
jgi:hypothetical protein